jgi:hypothetical protein
MSAKKKRQDAFKAKEKKQKIILAVGGVLLLGLLAFQVPRVMKQMHRGSASASDVPVTVSTPTSTSPTPSLAAPTTLRGEETGSSSTGSGSASVISADTDATQGHLASFSRFESKDPFQQQVDQSDPAPATAAPSSRPASGSASATTASPSSGSRSSGPTGSGASGGTKPAPGGVVISVNGTPMTVAVGSDFPAASPLFHLLSATSTTAKIAIAGGSYSNGAASVSLHVNKPVTLMNTADGTRYRLILKPQGTPVPAAAAPTSVGTTSSTPASTPSP